MTEAEHRGSNSHETSRVDFSYDLELEALISMFKFDKTCGQHRLLQIDHEFQVLPLPSRFLRRNRRRASNVENLECTRDIK
jgi:hypothetical protein